MNYLAFLLETAAEGGAETTTPANAPKLAIPSRAIFVTPTR